MRWFVLTSSVLFLLFLNLASWFLVKISPAFYGQYLMLAGLIAVVTGSYLIQTIIWLWLGRYYQISYVYPMLSINYVLSLFVGMIVFHEPFVLQRFVGAVIILVGVVFISSSRHRHEIPPEGRAT